MTVYHQNTDGAQTFAATIEATADLTLNRADGPVLVSNLGATGTVKVTLPQNAKAGDMVQVFVAAAYALQIDPGAAGAIYINGAKQTDDKYIVSAEIGDTVQLVADGNGDWYASGYQLLNVSGEWLAASVDKRIFTATRAWQVIAARGTVTAAGSDGSAVSMSPMKVPSGSAVASGVALTTAALDLKGTANTVQTLTLTATLADRKLAASDSIGFDFTGTLTAATGVASLVLSPWQVEA